MDQEKHSGGRNLRAKVSIWCFEERGGGNLSLKQKYVTVSDFIQLYMKVNKYNTIQYNTIQYSDSRPKASYVNAFPWKNIKEIFVLENGASCWEVWTNFFLTYNPNLWCPEYEMFCYWEVELILQGLGWSSIPPKFQLPDYPRSGTIDAERKGNSFPE